MLLLLEVLWRGFEKNLFESSTGSKTNEKTKTNFFDVTTTDHARSSNLAVPSRVKYQAGHPGERANASLTSNHGKHP